MNWEVLSFFGLVSACSIFQEWQKVIQSGIVFVLRSANFTSRSNRENGTEYSKGLNLRPADYQSVCERKYRKNKKPNRGYQGMRSFLPFNIWWTKFEKYVSRIGFFLPQKITVCEKETNIVHQYITTKIKMELLVKHLHMCPN